MTRQRHKKRRTFKHKLEAGRNRPDLREFKDSFQFGQIFKHKYKHTKTLIVCALAMSWNKWRDKLRLQMLLNLTPGNRIVTCNDNLHSCGNMQHVHCTFRTKRGQMDLADRVQAARAEYSHARIVIILDYYWFQQGYYIRHGLNE